jgi:hypothetical protein
VFSLHPIFREGPLASALPAPEQTDKVLRSSLPVGNWIVLYAFVVDTRSRLRMNVRFAPTADVPTTTRLTQLRHWRTSTHFSWNISRLFVHASKETAEQRTKKRFVTVASKAAVSLSFDSGY